MPALSFLLYEFIWYGVFLFALWHAIGYFGKRKALVFFLPAALWGFLLEYSTQEVFHRYLYGDGFLLYLFNVPLNISLAWASLLYFGYYLSREKLKLDTLWKRSLAAAVPLLLLDLLVFEPLAKTFGYWVWTPEGMWFGSSLGNIYGWFWVIVLYLTAFQLIDARNWEWKKSLAANLAAIALNVAILMALLKLWTTLFGNA